MRGWASTSRKLSFPLVSEPRLRAPLTCGPPYAVFTRLAPPHLPGPSSAVFAPTEPPQSICLAVLHGPRHHGADIQGSWLCVPGLCLQFRLWASATVPGTCGEPDKHLLPVSRDGGEVNCTVCLGEASGHRPVGWAVEVTGTPD